MIEDDRQTLRQNAVEDARESPRSWWGQNILAMESLLVELESKREAKLVSVEEYAKAQEHLKKYGESNDK